ncbi:hypothetical protein Tco_0206688 [Tanacetum coccineum]
MTPDGRLELKEKVFQWLKEGMIRKVRHPVWVANTIPVKLANGTWKVQVDYSSLNKVCAKDMYPFLEEGEGLASIMGYPYKCFLEMTEDDEEKTGFHTEEGVYYFTHMPKELKNSVATLQRMTEEVLADQRGRNVEIYLEEIVIKSKSELYLVQDVEETLRKLKRVNIKIDLVTSSFRVKEGRFLGFMVTKEGVRADPKKVLAMILYLTPKIPNQIRNELNDLNNWYQSHGALDLGSTRLFEEVITKTIEYCVFDVVVRFHRREAEGSVAKKFFRQGEQVEETPNANKGGKPNLSRKLQAKSTLTPRAWRLYLGRETIEEGFGVGIILVSPKEKMYSYAIRLKYERLACLHGFTKVGSQTEGNHTPATEQERKYKKEIMDATAPFHKFRITHLPKNLNSKAEVLTGLATIKLEFLNQEVSVSIKTKPSVEEMSSKKGKAASNVPGAKPNYNWKASRSNLICSKPHTQTSMYK